MHESLFCKIKEEKEKDNLCKIRFLRKKEFLSLLICCKSAAEAGAGGAPVDMRDSEGEPAVSEGGANVATQNHMRKKGLQKKKKKSVKVVTWRSWSGGGGRRRSRSRWSVLIDRRQDLIKKIT